MAPVTDLLAIGGEQAKLGQITYFARRFLGKYIGFTKYHYPNFDTSLVFVVRSPFVKTQKAFETNQIPLS